MITSIANVEEQFFRQFFGKTITTKGVTKQIPLRHARKSSLDYTEEDLQAYPVISGDIQTPSIKPEWFVDKHKYIGGLSLDGLTAYVFERPVWLEFVCDVSIASKSYFEHTTLKNLFASLYQSELAFLFNKKVIGEDAVGDLVRYDLRVSDVPRTDGVFETNYEFTISPWVHLKDPEEVQVVTDLVLTLQQNTL